MFINHCKKYICTQYFMLDYMYLVITCIEYWSSLSIEFLPTDEVI